MEPNTQPTQSGERVSQGLQGVRQRARENKQEKFTALLHHVTVERLGESYAALKRKAAPGVDGVTWGQYGEGLEGRLEDLHDLIAASVRLEQNRASEHRVFAEQMRGLVEVPVFDGGAEAVGEHVSDSLTCHQGSVRGAQSLTRC